MAHWPPLNRRGHWTSHQYPSHWVANGYPKNKYLQWQCHTRKEEVSFEQWYHKLQCVKDHYPESVVWESIARSLKGAVAEMAQYMGPTTSVAHILQKLAIIFSLWHHSMSLCRIFTRLPRVTTRTFPPLPQG